MNQKTAWFMLHRLRLAMQSNRNMGGGGPVEADETYIGGKAHNTHASKRKKIAVKPTNNATIESFNGRSREECLNVHWFASLEDALRSVPPSRMSLQGRDAMFLAWWTTSEAA